MVFNRVKSGMNVGRRSVNPHLVIGLLVLASWTAEGQSELSKYLEDEATMQRLERGNIVSIKGVAFDEVSAADAEANTRGTLILFLVSGSVETAWEVLTNIDLQHTFMPRMTKSETKSTDGDSLYARFKYDVLWVDSIVHLWGTRDPDTKTLVWRLDAQNSDKRLKELSIVWRVMELDNGRTLMAFFQHIKYTSSINTIGSRLLVSPRTTVRAVRKRVESLETERDTGRTD